MLRRITLVVAAFLSGCAFLRPAKVPMPSLRYPGAPAGDRLLLLLPGRGDRNQDFERRGFVAMARSAGVTADIVAADAHLGYYRNRSVAHRLAADLLTPPSGSTYRTAWVAGISLGGLGGLLLARDEPDRVQGLVVLAPYLGPDPLIAEIESAGGLGSWTPRREGDFEDVWVWLKGYATGAPRPPLYLAFGESDRYASAHRALARVLPPDHVLIAAGGHDWPTWRVLWERALRLPMLSGPEGSKAPSPTSP